MKNIRFLAALTALLLPLSDLAAQTPPPPAPGTQLSPEEAAKHLKKNVVSGEKVQAAMTDLNTSAQRSANAGAGSIDQARAAGGAALGNYSGAGSVGVDTTRKQQELANKDASKRKFGDSGTDQAKAAANQANEQSPAAQTKVRNTNVPVNLNAAKADSPNRWNPAIAGVKGGIYGGLLGLIFGGGTGMVLFAAIGFVIGYGMHKLNN
ncbi:MAG: hypothetical protein WC881_09050 [Elusimicrobiota bacterium]